VINVQDLTYAYPGADGPAVSGVTFEVAPGEIFALLGPSGADKSTAQQVLTRQNRRPTGPTLPRSRRAARRSPRPPPAEAGCSEIAAIPSASSQACSRRHSSPLERPPLLLLVQRHLERELGGLGDS
jgi:energy-coupling factor transporter ATP-binding protein EcfA2